MKKIAVMLPIGYRGGSLRAAKGIAKAIAVAGRQRNDEIQVVFSYVQEGRYDLYSDFNDLKELGISLRETVWKVISLNSLRASIQLLEIDPAKLISNDYCLPTDGANDFFDCDLWLIISDRLPAPLFPIRKYACVIYDYVQRYAPEVFDNRETIWERQERSYFSLVQNAEQVFVTTPSTRADMISYAGVAGSRITLLDMDFEPPNVDESVPIQLDLPEEYFVWSTNSSPHKNHIRAFKALGQYYQEHGGKLDVVITGANTEYFDHARTFPPDDPIINLPYVAACRNSIQNSLILRDHVHIMGNISDAVYARVLQNARFLWNPCLYDNGTFTVIEAAYFRRPSLSAWYPAMDYINEKFKLNLSYFDPHNTTDMSAALARMEGEYKNISMSEPDELLQHGWRAKAPALYQAIQDIL